MMRQSLGLWIVSVDTESMKYRGGSYHILEEKEFPSPAKLASGNNIMHIKSSERAGFKMQYGQRSSILQAPYGLTRSLVEPLSSLLNVALGDRSGALVVMGCSLRLRDALTVIVSIRRTSEFGDIELGKLRRTAPRKPRLSAAP
jgi:hypothetical protein